VVASFYSDRYRKGSAVFYFRGGERPIDRERKMLQEDRRTYPGLMVMGERTLSDQTMVWGRVFVGPGKTYLGTYNWSASEERDTQEGKEDAGPMSAAISH